MSDTPRLSVVGPNGWPGLPSLPEDDAVDDVLEALEQLTERHGELAVYLAMDAYVASGRAPDDDDDER